MLQLFRFGGVGCDFQNYQRQDVWDIPRWKLDPYRDSSVMPDIVVQNGISEPTMFPVENASLLFSEINGFFLRQVLPAPDGGVVCRLIRTRNQEVELAFHVSVDWETVSLLSDASRTGGSLAFEFLGQIMPFLFLPHDVLTFHGVLMEHDGRGIVISAASGVGKTTHARLWRDHKRALIINGDRAACRKVNGVWTGFGLPWSGTSGEQINRSVPLRALVILERGEKNEAHRINGLEAFGAAWPHVQYPAWDETMTGKALELTDDFLSEIPVIRLTCRPDEEAMEVLSKALEECQHE